MTSRTGPALTVDCVVLTPDNQVLLIRRGKGPFRGQWALPGGFVDMGESAEAACARELQEETAISMSASQLTLIGVYCEPGRDPRGHVCSIAYLASARNAQNLNAGDDASDAKWHPLSNLPQLAFDHARIIEDAVSKHAPS